MKHDNSAPLSLNPFGSGLRMLLVMTESVLEGAVGRLGAQFEPVRWSGTFVLRISRSTLLLFTDVENHPALSMRCAFKEEK